MVSYLGVFKRHRADDYLLSHGLDGWSLALDFKVPHDAQRLWDTAADLTRLVLEAGGTFYPAKDQVVDARSFARAFGERFTRFRDWRRRMDPDDLFANDQARRLGLA
jgi:FAD/FMN-containing dehydrogenase